MGCPKGKQRSGVGQAAHVARPHSKPTDRLGHAMGCRKMPTNCPWTKAQVCCRSPPGAHLVLLWSWGGGFQRKKSTSISSGCGKGYRWLRLTLQGGTWDLSRFLKYYLCLSNRNWVRAEHVPKQKLLRRVLAEAGKALTYQVKMEKKMRSRVCKHIYTPR